MRTSLALLIASAAAAWSANDASVAQRGPHHALWQRVTARTTSYGKTYYVTNSYLELGTGKHHLKDGQWVPSITDIAVLPSGFGVATQLQHQIIFAPNINTAGAIDCLMPDDNRLRGHVLGLAYTDKATGHQSRSLWGHPLRACCPKYNLLTVESSSLLFW